MIKLRDYQEEISTKAVDILTAKKIVYLAMEVRTGKTLTALSIANRYGAKKVLFLTKKKAIESGTILNDYNLLHPSFEIQIINNESLHKVVDSDFDLLISDEHHRNGSFPKPNKTTKEIKQRFGHLPMIFLSGTPAAESGSQYYHQFWISNYSPFKYYRNFYDWARIFTRHKVKYLGAIQIPDYSDSIDDSILENVSPYILRYTQKEAGFKSDITERILYCKMLDRTRSMIKMLIEDEVIVGQSDTIIADTAAAMMTKVHQLANGTIITEGGKSIITDDSKAKFIQSYFAGKKIAIFYYFQKEKEMLKTIFGDSITDDINEFNSTDKNFMVQQISGSEAISLKDAEALVYYNYGYSGKSYIQGRDRMTTKEREENNVYFVFEDGDINSRIYKSVKNKKRYNEKLFCKDFRKNFAK